MLVINNTYDIGDICYLKTDQDQKPRQVCAIEVFKAGELLYRLIQGTVVSSHYEFEISKEKDVVNAI